MQGRHQPPSRRVGDRRRRIGRDRRPGPVPGPAGGPELSDLVIRSGLVVTTAGVSAADIAISEGVISAIGPDLGSAPEEIDAMGPHVLPGGIDSPVHFNEPGHTDWETIASGSAALAAGGYSCFVDMPLNNLSVTIDSDSLDDKIKAARASH